MGLINSENWDVNSNKIIYIALISKSNICDSNVSFKFLSFIYNELKPDFLGCVGFNEKVNKIFNKIGHCSKLEHFYILNRSIMPKITKKLQSSNFKKNENLEMKIQYRVKSLPKSKYFPKKSVKYFNNKYSKNPFYKYFYLNFYYKKKLIFFFVARKIKVNKYKSLLFRVVDFYGNLKENINIANKLNKFLMKNKAEYIDFLNYGINSNLLLSIGFKKKNKNQLIPNYFEPFIMKNENIDISILRSKFNHEKINIFKGDGDQDRPNKI